MEQVNDASVRNMALEQMRQLPIDELIDLVSNPQDLHSAYLASNLMSCDEAIVPCIATEQSLQRLFTFTGVKNPQPEYVGYFAAIVLVLVQSMPVQTRNFFNSFSTQLVALVGFIDCFTVKEVLVYAVLKQGLRPPAGLQEPAQAEDCEYIELPSLVGLASLMTALMGKLSGPNEDAATNAADVLEYIFALDEFRQPPLANELGGYIGTLTDALLQQGVETGARASGGDASNAADLLRKEEAMFSHVLRVQLALLHMCAGTVNGEQLELLTEDAMVHLRRQLPFLKLKLEVDIGEHCSTSGQTLRTVGRLRILVVKIIGALLQLREGRALQEGAAGDGGQDSDDPDDSSSTLKAYHALVEELCRLGLVATAVRLPLTYEQSSHLHSTVRWLTVDVILMHHRMLMQPSPLCTSRALNRGGGSRESSSRSPKAIRTNVEELVLRQLFDDAQIMVSGVLTVKIRVKSSAVSTYPSVHSPPSVLTRLHLKEVILNFSEPLLANSPSRRPLSPSSRRSVHILNPNRSQKITNAFTGKRIVVSSGTIADAPLSPCAAHMPIIMRAIIERVTGGYCEPEDNDWGSRNKLGAESAAAYRIATSRRSWEDFQVLTAELTEAHRSYTPPIDGEGRRSRSSSPSSRGEEEGKQEGKHGRSKLRQRRDSADDYGRASSDAGSTHGSQQQENGGGFFGSVLAIFGVGSGAGGDEEEGEEHDEDDGEGEDFASELRERRERDRAGDGGSDMEGWKTLEEEEQERAEAEAKAKAASPSTGTVPSPPLESTANPSPPRPLKLSINTSNRPTLELLAAAGSPSKGIPSIDDSPRPNLEQRKSPSRTLGHALPVSPPLEGRTMSPMEQRMCMNPVSPPASLSDLSMSPSKAQPQPSSILMGGGSNAARPPSPSPPSTIPTSPTSLSPTPADRNALFTFFRQQEPRRLCEVDAMFARMRTRAGANEVLKDLQTVYGTAPQFSFDLV
jgi:hypothetical protein